MPHVVTQVVDERSIPESRGLAEEHSDRGAVSDRLWIQLL